jgi:dTDP-glucose pyrophosphorylase
MGFEDDIFKITPLAIDINDTRSLHVAELVRDALRNMWKVVAAQLGLRLAYAEQPHPGGLAQAFILGEDFIDKYNVCLILGDNIFYGYGLSKMLEKAGQLTNGSLVFCYWVKDPERYGDVAFDETGKAVSLEGQD